MNKSIVSLTEALPSLIQNSSFTIALAGWPAAVTVIAICIAGVTMYALKVSHSSNDVASEVPE